VLNWHKYNESLVRREEVLLHCDVIDNWDSEIDGNMLKRLVDNA